jgi:hypothetical protein
VTLGSTPAPAPAGVTIDYPKEGSVFPPDFAAPTFLWHDGGQRADRWNVEWVFANGGASLRTPVDAGEPPKGEIDPRCISVTNELYTPTPYQTSALAWRPPRDVWAAVVERAAGGSVAATFTGWNAGDAARPLGSGRVRFSVSTDPVGAPIFYRDVPLMPSASTDERSWLNRGSIRLSQSDAAGAEADFSRAAELNPEDAHAWSGKGMACWSLGDLPCARASFDRALALDASDVSAWYFRAKARRATGDLAGALQDLDRAAALAPAGSPPALGIEALRRELRDALKGTLP